MSPFFKTAIFTILVPGTALVVVPWFILRRWPPGEFDAIFAALGSLLIGLGGALYLWCAFNFAGRGQGTPAPLDPPKFLVSGGPYAVIRNPMYVAVQAVLLGEATLFRSLALFIASLVAFVAQYLFVVSYEEPTLREKFGESYERYCERVPRWVPKRNGRVRPPIVR